MLLVHKCTSFFLTYSNNNSFRSLCSNLVNLVSHVSTQADNQIKIPLIRIRFALLAHIVRSGLAKMQSTNSHLAHLFISQLDSKQTNKQKKIKFRISHNDQHQVRDNSMNLTLLDEMPFCFDQIEIVQF